jgi:uncharacterized membrane protein YraQ (UPF0718 family)
MKKPEKSYASWYFLLGVLVIYLLLAFIKPEAFMAGLKFFSDIIIKVIPVFILIFILMIIVNRFLSAKQLMKYLGKEAGLKAWAAAIITGIISSGPIYLWYPLLKDLQKHGVRNGLVAVFLYNRAVKLPLLALMIFYFGLVYILVLTGIMIIASVFQGIVVEKIVGASKI